MTVDRDDWTVNGELRSTKTRPWLNFLKVNINSNNATSGDTLIEWQQPNGPYLYEFYLYKQEGMIDVQLLADDKFASMYSSPCSITPGR